MEGEVPIGCVVTLGDEIVGRGRNCRENSKNALGHAELMAIHEACRRLGGWRLWQCRLYVTLEPCPMCAGAIINARIPVVIYGAKDPKAGSVDSVAQRFSLGYNHHPQVISGVFGGSLRPDTSGFFSDAQGPKDAKTDGPWGDRLLTKKDISRYYNMTMQFSNKTRNCNGFSAF